MFKTLFDEEFAASKTKRQQLDHLLRITAPHERILLVVIGAMLVAFSVWSVSGSVVRSVTLDGVLLEPGARHEIVAAEPGYLMELLVTPGDRVEAGGPIARQSVPGLEREVAALRDRIAMLEQESRRGSVADGSLDKLLIPARMALLEMEARRDARELITSQTGGVVMALRAAPGSYLAAGASVALVRETANRPPQAALRAPAGLVRQIRPQLPAVVEVALPNGERQRLEGEVAAVNAGGATRWLQELLPESADAAHRVDITLRQTQDLAVPDGTPCRVKIILGEHPPAALINLQWSWTDSPNPEEQG